MSHAGGPQDKRPGNNPFEPLLRDDHDLADFTRGVEESGVTPPQQPERESEAQRRLRKVQEAAKRGAIRVGGAVSSAASQVASQAKAAVTRSRSGSQASEGASQAGSQSSGMSGRLSQAGSRAKSAAKSAVRRAAGAVSQHGESVQEFLTRTGRGRSESAGSDASTSSTRQRLKDLTTGASKRAEEAKGAVRGAFKQLTRRERAGSDGSVKSGASGRSRTESVASAARSVAGSVAGSVRSAASNASKRATEAARMAQEKGREAAKWAGAQASAVRAKLPSNYEMKKQIGAAIEAARTRLPTGTGVKSALVAAEQMTAINATVGELKHLIENFGRLELDYRSTVVSHEAYAVHQAVSLEHGDFGPSLKKLADDIKVEADGRVTMAFPKSSKESEVLQGSRVDITTQIVAIATQVIETSGKGNRIDIKKARTHNTDISRSLYDLAATIINTQEHSLVPGSPKPGVTGTRGGMAI